MSKNKHWKYEDLSLALSDEWEKPVVITRIGRTPAAIKTLRYHYDMYQKRTPIKGMSSHWLSLFSKYMKGHNTSANHLREQVHNQSDEVTTEALVSSLEQAITRVQEIAVDLALHKAKQKETQLRQEIEQSYAAKVEKMEQELQSLREFRQAALKSQSRNPLNKLREQLTR